MLMEEGGTPHNRSHSVSFVTAVASVSLHAERTAVGRLSLLSGKTQKYTTGGTPGMDLGS